MTTPPEPADQADQAARRREEWLRDNQAALDSSNAYVERHGLPLGRYHPSQEKALSEEGAE